ncbi:hypothetical protein SAMN02910369_01647 [Lachnospiraceae bacterium NE2001]|nr:hypothetical protein SAMN02910369_01647 [Lachnospiraceae bacterium NE2001]
MAKKCGWSWNTNYVDEYMAYNSGKENEKEKILAGIDELIETAKDLRFHFDEYAFYSERRDMPLVIEKYLKSLSRLAERWDKMRARIVEEGIDNAGDYSFLSLQYKINLGYKQIDLAYDEFKAELKRMGVEEDIVPFQLPEHKYFAKYLMKAERGEKYTLPDTVNLQLRRELKSLEKEIKEVQNELYKARYGSRKGNDFEVIQLLGKCSQLENEIAVRRRVLTGAGR